LATSFNLENKFFLSSALPENWQKKSRIDLDICRKPALNEGGAMVSRPGFAIAGASIIFRLPRGQIGGVVLAKQWPSFAKF
jgi:hypothetical protein